MPLKKEDLPQTLQRSPKKVRDAYVKTLDSAEDTYDGDEERAHRTAWSSVKHIAEKKGDHWEVKDEYGSTRARRRRSCSRTRATRTSQGARRWTSASSPRRS
jgi:cation transport regulator ChaB